MVSSVLLCYTTCATLLGTTYFSFYAFSRYGDLYDDFEMTLPFVTAVLLWIPPALLVASQGALFVFLIVKEFFIKDKRLAFAINTVCFVMVALWVVVLVFATYLPMVKLLELVG